MMMLILLICNQLIDVSLVMTISIITATIVVVVVSAINIIVVVEDAQFIKTVVVNTYEAHSEPANKRKLKIDNEDITTNKTKY